MRLQCLLVALVAVTAAAPLPAVAAGGPVKFALEMDGGIVLPVRIGGAGPYRFRLDTGASRTVVTAALATRLASASGGNSTLVTPTGVTRSSLARLPPLEFGCGTPAPVSALVLPDLALDPGGRIDGLIGQDILARASYTIDFGRRQLECGPPGLAPTAGLHFALVVTGGRALVTLPTRDGAALQLVPDTGADRLVLFARPNGDGPPVTPLDVVRLRSVAGHRLVRRVLVHGLDLGGRVHRDLDALLLDQRLPEMGDGLLPLSLFARVTLDAPGGRLIVEHR